jgi:two-component system NtrC family sensor kinase
VHIPVQKLTEGTREVSSGHLDHLIPIHSSDEIGILAQSFNQMTEKIKKMQDQIVQVEKMASLGKLSLTVAHELNNPLSGILNYASLALKNLKKEGLSAEEKRSTMRDLEIIQTETARCGNIVKNLLLFSRKLDTGQTKEQLHPIIENSIELVAHHFELKQIGIARCYLDGDDTIFCVPDQLKQAFIALFINAAESMEKGGTIEVSTQRIQPENGYRICIRDTGCGIPEELLPKVFEPFFTTKIDGKGVGLGLSIVYGVIKRHGGTIQVESHEGKGTTFTIEIPRNGPPYNRKKEGLSDSPEEMLTGPLEEGV